MVKLWPSVDEGESVEGKGNVACCLLLFLPLVHFRSIFFVCASGAASLAPRVGTCGHDCK